MCALLVPRIVWLFVLADTFLTVQVIHFEDIIDNDENKNLHLYQFRLHIRCTTWIFKNVWIVHLLTFFLN